MTVSYINKIRQSLGSPLLPNDDPLSKKIEGSIFSTIEYKIDTIVEKLNNINNLDENEIKNIILRQYHTIFNYDLFLRNPKERACAQKLFSNKIFLKILLDMIWLLELTKSEIICINKLAYDYYILPEKDSEVSNLLILISYQVNNKLSIQLSAILGVNNARILSMIANSSFVERKNVDRINTFLVKCNLSLSVQNMIDIYCILFEKFTYPFLYTMIETDSSIIFTIEQKKRFDNISIALLEILNSLTSNDMEIVLKNYGYSLKLMNVENVRFSLKSATKYPRILSVIKNIELNDPEGIIIP